MLDSEEYPTSITAIIVIYNTTSEVLNCLDNLKNIPVIIVDNGNCDKKIIKKILKYKNIKKYLKPKKNLGFGRANNFAFKYVKTKYTLIINSDVKINLKNIQKLSLIIKKYPHTGIAVPSLLDSNLQNNDFLEIIPEKGKGIERNHFEKEISDKLSKTLISGDTCINFCWAAIMLIDNEIIRKVGLFDKKYFLYWEDYDLCRKLSINRIPIIKSNEIRASNLKSSSVKKSVKNYFIIQLFHVFSSYQYFKLDKKSNILTKRAYLYFFRFISYIFILNFKNSLKNLARLYAVLKYKFN